MEDWARRVGSLRRWSRGGERAPHKPLLMLYALARYQRDPDQGLAYGDVERDLARLLADFGPARATSPAYPFHHLVADGVWEVRTRNGPGSPGTGVGALRASGATGRLAPELREALDGDPGLLDRLARTLLDANFPPTLHADICDATGLRLDAAAAAGSEPSAELRRRDPFLREAVLEAYEYRCAFCGYEGMIDRAAAGLEAAHVRWWAFGGPDEVDNGLCLCALHHKLFDTGVMGLTPERRITVSRRFVGRGEAARRQVLDLSGRGLFGPQPGSGEVARDHIAWHTGQVFRGAPRGVAAGRG